MLIKSDADWEIYYDHGATQTLGRNIAINGMETTIERVRRISLMGVDDLHVYQDAIWVEGMVLIERD